jgi:hypothetical protein
MTTPQPTSPPAPKAGGSRWFGIGLVVLAVAAAGGYYLYVKSQNPIPPPPDKNLREYCLRVGQGLKMAPEYQDANGDLVADPPTDPAKFVKVEEIAFTVVPSEDP